MAAYCFFDVQEIVDPAKMEQYRSDVLATVKQYSGRYLVVGGTCEVVEGTWQPVTPVLTRFPDLQQAYKWYNSEEYRELKALRLAGSKGHAVFMETEASEFIEED